MKTRYRVVEVMRYGDKVQYQVESFRWWWPFWMNDGAYPHLEDALNAISEAKAKAEFKRKVVYKSN